MSSVAFGDSRLHICCARQLETRFPIRRNWLVSERFPHTLPERKQLAAVGTLMDWIARGAPAGSRQRLVSASPAMTKHYESLFKTDKHIVFGLHGYPWLSHRHARRRNSRNCTFAVANKRAQSVRASTCACKTILNIFMWSWTSSIDFSTWARQAYTLSSRCATR